MGRQNGVTIKDVLKMNCMEKCKLIAGFKGVDNTVSRVNIMADPDILNWVHEGELLLTTAYSFRKDSIEIQKKLIKECSRKGLAGIGIKIHPYLKRLSSEVIDLANTLNFPIIDLYYDIPFSDIMTPIFKEIFNKEALLLQRLDRIHEELMNAMLSGASIESIANVIHKNLNNPVLIKLEFPNKQIMKFGDLDKYIKELLINNMRSFYNSSSFNYHEKKFTETTELISGKYIKRVILPIVVKNTIYGHIFSWAIDTPFSGFDLSILETASTTIALEILKKLSVSEVENRYKSEYLEDLISLDKKRKKKALERASFFNLGLDNIYVVSIINLINSHMGKDKLSTDEVQQTISGIIRAIKDLMNKLDIKGFVSSKTDSIRILLFDSDGERLTMKIGQIRQNIKKVLDNKITNLEYRAGFGRPYKGLENVYKSYTDAIKAIHAGEILGESKITSFNELGIYKLLCNDNLKDEMEIFYNETLKILVEYDKNKSTELVKTLESYFKYNGNLKQMSKALFTHYNTVLYRIQRIKEITGMDLDNAEDRLNLQIALKIKPILDV
ncbi:CdaR family transcriptional regulator [Thermohalobacter berrensis]|uniref:CdaR family transcriptional regulator n=1 Tax=Thermohalobacter berrensis TaxID=99594 RepID=A0A419T284_9FIRM|nr:CdaR family transcriptional regulator [Thermohalobacter berrensis]